MEGSVARSRHLLASLDLPWNARTDIRLGVPRVVDPEASDQAHDGGEVLGEVAATEGVTDLGSSPSMLSAGVAVGSWTLETGSLSECRTLPLGVGPSQGYGGLRRGVRSGFGAGTPPRPTPRAGGVPRLRLHRHPSRDVDRERRR